MRNGKSIYDVDCATKVLHMQKMAATIPWTRRAHIHFLILLTGIIQLTKEVERVTYLTLKFHHSLIQAHAKDTKTSILLLSPLNQPALPINPIIADLFIFFIFSTVTVMAMARLSWVK